jgi:hypothetical protein
MKCKNTRFQGEDQVHFYLATETDCLLGLLILSFSEKRLLIFFKKISIEDVFSLLDSKAYKN